MYKNGQKKGTIRFTVAADAASKAFVAGDFTDWQPVRMKKQKGRFGVTVPVPPGSHHYKYILDDQWTRDPDNSDWAVSPMGTINSVVVAE